MIKQSVCKLFLISDTFPTPGDKIVTGTIYVQHLDLFRSNKNIKGTELIKKKYALTYYSYNGLIKIANYSICYRTFDTSCILTGMDYITIPINTLCSELQFHGWSCASKGPWPVLLTYTDTNLKRKTSAVFIANRMHCDIFIYIYKKRGKYADWSYSREHLLQYEVIPLG